MGSMNLGAEDFESSFKEWLQQQEGNVTAEELAKAWNKIARKEKWHDRLQHYEVEQK